VLAVVSQKLPDFVHNGRPGAFRAWLRAILANKVRRFLEKRSRAGAPLPDWLNGLDDPSSDLSRQWDLEHDQYLVRRLLAAIRPEFQPRTWEVFRLLVLEDRRPAEVAQRCGMTPNAVHRAKWSVLNRLRQELGGLVGT